MKNTTKDSHAPRKDAREPTVRTEANDQAPSKSQARSMGVKMPPPCPDRIEGLLSFKAAKVTAKLLHHLKPGSSRTAKIKIEPTAQVSCSLSWSDYRNRPGLLCLSMMIYTNTLQVDTKAFLVPKLLQA